MPKKALQIFLIAGPTAALFFAFVGPAAWPWVLGVALLSLPLLSGISASWQALQEMGQE